MTTKRINEVMYGALLFNLGVAYGQYGWTTAMVWDAMGRAVVVAVMWCAAAWIAHRFAGTGEHR